MAKSEAQTRSELIGLQLAQSGWYETAYNIAPWLDYFWGELLRVYKEFEERFGTIERGRGAKGDRVRVP